MFQFEPDQLSSILIEDFAELTEPEKAMALDAAGKCVHPISLRFGARCIGCKAVFDSASVGTGRALPRAPLSIDQLAP